MDINVPGLCRINNNNTEDNYSNNMFEIRLWQNSQIKKGILESLW